MINSLEELRNSLTLDDLNKYYEESIGKNPEEIKDLLKSHDVEISTECANDCYKFCESVIKIKESELNNVAGGTYGDPSIPSKIKSALNKAIDLLEDESKYNAEFLKMIAKQAAQDLRDLLNRQFDVTVFKQTLKDIVVGDIGVFVFSSNYLKYACDCIQHAQTLL